jgi:tetratricopeptide (TPR) repeat protein
VALHRRNGNRRGEAGAQLNLSWMSTLLGEYPVALDHVLSALAGFTELDDDVGRATTLNAVAYCHGKLGDFAQTVEYGERAVDLSRAIGYARFESGALDTVGVAYQQLGDHRRAIERCSRAVEILERLGDRYTAAQCLLNVAASEVALGDVPAARAAYERSLAVLDDLGHAEADAVRQKLAALPS